MSEYQHDVTMAKPAAIVEPVTPELEVARIIVAIKRLSDMGKFEVLGALSEMCNVTRLTVEVNTSTTRRGSGHSQQDKMEDIVERAKDGDAVAVEQLTQLMYCCSSHW